MSSLFAVASSKAAIKALDRSAHVLAYLRPEGRMFEWDASIPAATHKKDPKEGVYIAPNTNSNGAWVEKNLQEYRADWFGTDHTAINAAIDLANYTGVEIVRVPSKTFVCWGAVVPKDNVRLIGSGWNSVLIQKGPELFMPIEDWTYGEISHLTCKLSKPGVVTAYDCALRLRSHKFCEIHHIRFVGYHDATLQERFPSESAKENCVFNKYSDYYFDGCVAIDLAGGYEVGYHQHHCTKPELVTGGAFNHGISGWTVDPYVSATTSYDLNGERCLRLVVKNSTTGNKSCYQELTVVPGRSHSYEFTMSEKKPQAFYRIGTAPGLSDIAGWYAPGTETGTFVPTTNKVYVTMMFKPDAPKGHEATFTKVSVYETPGNSDRVITATKVWEHRAVGEVAVFREDEFRRLKQLSWKGNPGLDEFSLSFPAGKPEITLGRKLRPSERIHIWNGAPVKDGRKPISNCTFDNIKGDAVFSRGHQSYRWIDAERYTGMRIKLWRNGGRCFLFNPGDNRGSQAGDNATLTHCTMTHADGPDIKTLRCTDLGPGSFAMTGVALIADSGWEENGVNYATQDRGDPDGYWRPRGSKITISGKTVTGTGSNFKEDFCLGGSVSDELVINGIGYKIASIQDQRNLTLTTAAPSGTYTKFWRRNLSDSIAYRLQFAVFGTNRTVHGARTGVVLERGYELRSYV